MKNVNSIGDFINNNETEFDDKNFVKLLNSLILKSGRSKFKVATDSHISEPYMYNLSKGEKRPTRDTVVKLSFGLLLPLETAERLLKLAGYSGFYVRHKRDSILKFAVENNYGLNEVVNMVLRYLQTKTNRGLRLYCRAYNKIQPFVEHQIT